MCLRKLHERHYIPHPPPFPSCPAPSCRAFRAVGPSAIEGMLSAVGCLQPSPCTRGGLSAARAAARGCTRRAVQPGGAAACAFEPARPYRRWRPVCRRRRPPPPRPAVTSEDGSRSRPITRVARMGYRQNRRTAHLHGILRRDGKRRTCLSRGARARDSGRAGDLPERTGKCELSRPTGPAGFQHSFTAPTAQLRRHSQLRAAAARWQAGARRSIHGLGGAGRWAARKRSGDFQ